MILNKDEVNTLAEMFSNLDYRDCSESEKHLWRRVDEDLECPSDTTIFLRSKEIAERWGMCKQSIDNMRKDEKGPKYTKLHTGTILYDLVDVLEYEKLRVITPKHPL